MPTETDPFRELGVPRTATPGEVRDAWLCRTREYDPDHFRDAPDRVRERAARRLLAINEAYATVRWTQIVENAPLVFAGGDDWDTDPLPLPTAAGRSDAARPTAKPRRHRFGGFERIDSCCLATCRCGWVGPIAQSEDRALLQFAIHLTRAWTIGTRTDQR